MSIRKINTLIIISTIISALVGAIGGLNQTSLRKIIAFSSINHIAWIFIALNSSETLWTIYLIIYSILRFNIVIIFKTLKLNHINQLFSSMFISNTLKFSLIINILSLGGLPPFLGFFPKWIVIQTLVINNQIYIIVILTVTSLITLYFYLRIAYSALILNYNEINWINKQINNNINTMTIISISIISNFGLLTARLAII